MESRKLVQAISGLLRDRVSPRQGPIHFVHGNRLGGDGAYANLALTRVPQGLFPLWLR